MKNKSDEVNETKENKELNVSNILSKLNDLFPDLLQKIEYSNDPWNDLNNAHSAVVYYGLRCCEMRCCIPFTCSCSCEEIYKYNSYVKIGEVEKFLFSNLAYLNCFGTDTLCKFKKVSNMTYSSYNDYCNNNGIEFSRMDKRPGCVVCGLCGLYMNVYLPNENKLAGIVKFRGKCEDCFYCKDSCKGCCTCYDYYYSYDILNNVKTQMFSIYKKKCCLSCSYDCCDEIDYEIHIGDTKVGSIICKKNCCSCYGLCGEECVYTINFPSGCPPEIKLTIINGVIANDLFF